MNSSQPDPARQPASQLTRLLAAGAAFATLVLTWHGLAAISATDPWYRNTDMNSHNVIDALAINANVPPKLFEQPAVPLKYLLAVEYRALHRLGALPVWNLEEFDASPEPLREFSPLVRAARVHSRVIVLLLMLAAGGLVWSLTREWSAAGLAVVLLGGSAGLLFHGLLVRPELLCVAFGNVLAFLAATRATAARTPAGKHFWLFVAGILVGLAMLEKLPGIFYLGLCAGWCWLSALIVEKDSPAPPVAGFASGLIPAAGALALLGLTFALGPFHDVLGAVAVARLRGAAVVVALLPLLAMMDRPGRVRAFLLERTRELALLAGGVLAALPLMYLLLRAGMTEASAGRYLANALRFVFNPGPHMQALAPADQVGGQFLVFLRDTPFLFGGTVVLTIGASLLRGFPRQLKAASWLLLGSGLGLAFLLSRRYFTAQYGIFAQVPLLLVWPLVLSGLGAWWRARHPQAHPGWILAPGFLVAATLMVTAPSRVRPKYYFYQNDATLPVNHFTVTFLYDHDNHMDEYLQIMKAHYGTREQFTAALERYLANPANRR